MEKKIQNVPKSIRTTEGSKHSGTNLHQENMWSYKNKSNVKLPSGQANSGQQASGGRKLSKIAHPLWSEVQQGPSVNNNRFKSIGEKITLTNYPIP